MRSKLIEPSDDEQSQWPEATEAYVHALEAEKVRLQEQNKRHREVLVQRFNHIEKLTAENERLRSAIQFALIYDPYVDQYKIKHTAYPKLREALNDGSGK